MPARRPCCATGGSGASGANAAEGGGSASMSRRGEANSGVAEPAKGRDVSTVKLGVEASRSGAADDTAGAGATASSLNGTRSPAWNRPATAGAAPGAEGGWYTILASRSRRYDSPSYRHSSSWI